MKQQPLQEDHIRPKRKVQALSKIAFPPGLDVKKSDYPSITSGLTCEASKVGDDSLLGRASLALEPEGDDFYLLNEYVSLTGCNAYPIGGESLGASDATGITSASNVK